MSTVFHDRSQIRNQLKRKAYEDAGLQPPTTTTTKVPMKAVSATPESHSKKQKTSGSMHQLNILIVIHTLDMASYLKYPTPTHPPHSIIDNVGPFVITQMWFLFFAGKLY